MRQFAATVSTLMRFAEIKLFVKSFKNDEPPQTEFSPKTNASQRNA
jgi:hypothetical protein